MATPPGYELKPRQGESFEDVRLEVFGDPLKAAQGADLVTTDVWTSMGQESEAEWRRIAFAGYQVDERLMSLAAPDAAFMHCLPAHRGEEVTDAVLDGPRSIAIEQAENRLHLQKGLMARLLGRPAEEPYLLASRRRGTNPSRPNPGKATITVP